jgi:protein O-GlcNAc transferase
VDPPALQQARKLLAAGRFDEAAGHLARFLQRTPNHPGALAALTTVHAMRGEGDKALECARRAVAAAPRDAELLCNLGFLVRTSGDLDEALGHFEAALRADPKHLRSLTGISDVLYRMRRFAEAARRAEEGLRIQPHEPLLINNLASALVQTGRAREGLALLREGARAFPSDQTLVSSQAAFSNYADGVDPAERLRAHRLHARLLERAGPPLPPGPRPDNPQKRLRVGVLSSELNRHAVGRFVEPLFALGEGFEAWAYSTCVLEDPYSQRLRSLSASWRNVISMSDAQLAAQIRRDGIDILIETSGLTQENRLGAVRMRPAPVQVTAIGYPATTGMSEIGYRLVDSITDPPGEADTHATERLVRLDPCFLCFNPVAAAPADLDPGPGAGGAGSGGPVAFGSFNTLAKLDDTTVRTWGAVLRALPGSRLVLKAFALGEDQTRALTLARFAAEGVNPSRVEIVGPTVGYREHLESYHRVDIALDTYPYNGTTTTCEALYMGVPVVSLAGSVHASRVGASLLSAVGLPELVAATPEEFLTLATGLAADRGRLDTLRSTLRERLLGSALCDRAAYAARLAGALRAFWRAACGTP